MKRLFLIARKVWMRDGQYGKHHRGRLVKKAPPGGLEMKLSWVDCSTGSMVPCRQAAEIQL